VISAVNEGIRKADADAEQKMGQITGGMGMGNLGGIGGLGGLL